MAFLLPNGPDVCRNCIVFNLAIKKMLMVLIRTATRS